MGEHDGRDSVTWVSCKNGLRRRRRPTSRAGSTSASGGPLAGEDVIGQSPDEVHEQRCCIDGREVSLLRVAVAPAARTDSGGWGERDGAGQKRDQIVLGV